MRNLPLLFSVILVASSAFAEVVLSVEHPFSIGILKNLDSALETARTRAPEMKKYPFIAPILDAQKQTTPLTLVCAPQMPDSSGEGCSLMITAQKAKPGELSVSFRDVVSQAVIRSALQKMDAVLMQNPNSVEDWDHKQIGNPLSRNSGNATHVYCASAGKVPDKVWTCMLFASEKSNL